MNTRGMEPEFREWVRDALTHLYDYAYLQSHPLSHALVWATEEQTNGATLYRVLVETMEELRPLTQVPLYDAVWRPYLALHRRYIEGLKTDQIAGELSISKRQLRREQQKGLDTLTELLWEKALPRLGPAGTGSRSPGKPVGALDSELDRLVTASPPDAGTSVPRTVHSVLRTLSDLGTRRGIQFVVDLPETLPLVSIERVALRQALLNILSHLLAVSQNSTISLTGVAVGDEVLLSIHEPQSMLGSIRGWQDGTRLAVAGRLMEMQGGEMVIGRRTEMDAGVRAIQLRLPVRPTPTVLIIDDNTEVIQLFQRYLSGSPYRVLGASSSQEALHLTAEILPHAIILDVMMPHQDGWELLQFLKNNDATAEIPVIVCSVLQERSLAFSLGAVDFLAKPVTQQMLLGMLSQHL